MSTCSKAYTINSGGDVPLDSAIYSSNLGQIVGVRGQYLYTFNATTGAKISEKRIADDFIFAEASVAEVGSFLYVALWRRVARPTPFASYAGDIIRVTPATLAPTALGLGNSITGSGIGFSNLVTDGTFLYGTTGYSGQGTGSGMFQCDPLNAIATYVERTLLDVRGVVDLIWDADPATTSVWRVYGGGPEVYGIYAPTFPAVVRNVVNPTPAFICGGTIAPATHQMYCVGMNSTVLKVDIATAVASLPVNFDLCTASSLAILAASAKPCKIKYNAEDGLIYVPTWSGDTVEVLDPASDTITSIKTGFTAPHDCVFSPGHKWAVQQSAQGLKEII